MCGIAGLFSLKQKPIHVVAEIKKMSRQIWRRGPDDEGYLAFSDQKIIPLSGQDSIRLTGGVPYFSNKPITTLDEKVLGAFAHRRLSIVDLSEFGHQPMCDNTQQYWIVFNGEVYNYREIRAELVQLGHQFYSKTDTEVVLHAYIEWGASALEKFNGMFAFAILDRVDNSIFLARDRIGIKPLYYTIQKDIFVFGSDIKSLIASGLYHPEVNWEGVWHNFNFGMAPRPITCFQDIVALEQSHYLHINLTTGHIHKQRYWQIPVGTQDSTLSLSDASDMLEAALHKSIRYRLHSDVDVGTFMSGGVDSTTISAMASQQHPGIKAFTLGFDKSFKRYDEVEEAKATAAMHDFEHIISYIKPHQVLDDIDDIVLCYEEPFYHLPANFVISNIVHDNGVKVVLNGLGGDELFAGYSVYNRLSFWQKTYPFRLLQHVIPSQSHRKVQAVKRLLQAKTIGQYYASAYMKYGDLGNQRLFPRKWHFCSRTVLEDLYDCEKNAFTDDVEALNYYDLMNYIGNHHVHRTDQFTMFFSIEGRFPFLDHNLIESAFRIPSNYKLHNGVGKFVLRNVAEKYIAPSCLSMRKKGFGLPLEYWIKHDLNAFVQESQASLLSRQLLDNQEVKRIFQEGSASKQWQLVMFEQWYQQFIERRSFS